jgi:hypothetical protein
MEIDMVTILIALVVQVVVQIPVLWIVGRMLTSSQNAKFTDAIIIVILSNIANAVVGMFLSDIIAAVIQIVIYLFLIKKFYECDWGKAIMVAIIVGIVSAIIGAAMVIFLGIGTSSFV